MLYKYILSRKFTFICLATMAAQSIEAAVVPDEAGFYTPASWAGTKAIRAGKFDSAIVDISKKDTLKNAPGYRYFKLGIIEERRGNSGKAIFYFRSAAEKDRDLFLLAYQHIGDVEVAAEKPGYAMSAYRAVLDKEIPQQYRNFIFSKIKQIVSKDTATWASVPWLDEYRQWISAQKRPELRPAEPDTLDSLLSAGAWASADSYAVANATLDGPKACAMVRAYIQRGMPDSVLGTGRLFELAVAAKYCKLPADAERLFILAQKRHDFRKTVNQPRALYLKAQISFDKGNFTAAADQYKKYVQRYGKDAEAFMSIARAYRKLDKTKEAAEWYKHHVSAYPSHQRTEEILWLLGWIQEELGKPGQAAWYYRRIYTQFPRGKRAEESIIRHALCYYRKEHYDSALAVLTRLEDKYPESGFINTAWFWEAKCRLALDKTKDAMEILTCLQSRDPGDYYAHRSRQVLTLLGDTTSEFTVDTAQKAEIRQWLDSISPSSIKALTHTDSVNLKVGCFLSSMGLYDEAEYYLNRYEQAYPANLVLQYDLASMYWISDSPERAFRVARRLEWRIPQPAQKTMPSALYALLYPPFFIDRIKAESDYYNIDPYLVSAVIRQESIFNPKIVSPAGAIGLMQIMPYTGKALAQKIGVPFAQDSLYSPDLNIRFGTCYLRELLDQFNDNLVMVIASYNGGPNNVIKWYNQNKNEEFDLFVEDIAFTETRNYVKKVLSNYWTYRSLSQLPGFSLD